MPYEKAQKGETKMTVIYLHSENKVTSSEFYYKGGSKYTVFRNEDGEIVAVLKEPHLIRPEHVRKLLTNFNFFMKGIK